MMGTRSELGPECRACQARVGITEQSPDDAEMRHKMDERECEQVASREVGECCWESRPGLHDCNTSSTFDLRIIEIALPPEEKTKKDFEMGSQTPLSTYYIPVPRISHPAYDNISFLTATFQNGFSLMFISAPYPRYLILM